MQKKWTILVADDDPNITTLLQVIFDCEGYDVVKADTGPAALGVWERSGYPPLVLLDWNLPGMSGLDVCKTIRQKPEGKFAYIMFLTARGLRDSIIAGYNAGADDYVVKPFNAEELKARVKAGIRLLEMQRQLRERNTLLEELVYSVTHDMRTPLIAMDMTAAQAQEGIYGALPDSYGKILSTTRRSVQGLLSMIETLLRVARYENIENLEDARRSEIVEIAKQCVIELEPLYSKKSITLDVESNELEVWVKVDPQDMKRIIQNLIDNAIKFTQAEGQIKLNIERTSNKVIVGVQDSGKGVKKEEAKQVFERFSRANDVGHTPGTGLGLYLCRRIIETHGGIVDCIPRPSGGTTFGFLLPVEE